MTPRFDPTVEVDPEPQFYAPELEVGRDGRCLKCGGGFIRREPSRVVCATGCARQLEFRATPQERELQQRIDGQLSTSRRLARLENSRRTLTPG